MCQSRGSSRAGSAPRRAAARPRRARLGRRARGFLAPHHRAAHVAGRRPPPPSANTAGGCSFSLRASPPRCTSGTAGIMLSVCASGPLPAPVCFFFCFSLWGGSGWVGGWVWVVLSRWSRRRVTRGGCVFFLARVVFLLMCTAHLRNPLLAGCGGQEAVGWQPRLAPSPHHCCTLGRAVAARFLAEVATSIRVPRPPPPASTKPPPPAASYATGAPPRWGRLPPRHPPPSHRSAPSPSPSSPPIPPLLLSPPSPPTFPPPPPPPTAQRPAAGALPPTPRPPAGAQARPPPPPPAAARSPPRPPRAEPRRR